MGEEEAVSGARRASDLGVRGEARASEEAAMGTERVVVRAEVRSVAAATVGEVMEAVAMEAVERAVAARAVAARAVEARAAGEMGAEATVGGVKVWWPEVKGAAAMALQKATIAHILVE